MKVEAIALTDFQHDDVRAFDGRVIQPLLEEALAKELERAGLVRIRPPLTRVPKVRVFPTDVGKAPAAGAAAQSSASPAAPASRATTATALGRGSVATKRSAR
jgi:hypothetical protein